MILKTLLVFQFIMKLLSSNMMVQFVKSETCSITIIHRFPALAYAIVSVYSSLKETHV